jgi:hypothetical protein
MRKKLVCPTMAFATYERDHLSFCFTPAYGSCPTTRRWFYFALSSRSLNYEERRPFAFNGTIQELKMKLLQ